MHNVVNRRMATADRVIKFGEDHPIVPALATATALYTETDVLFEELRNLAGDQDGGRGEFRGATDIRQVAAEALLSQMRPINLIARALKRSVYPEVAEVFKLPSEGGYEGMISRAQAYLDAIPPLKVQFTSRGLAADFDTQLTAAKTALEAATAGKASGLAKQVGSTAGLLAKSKEVLDVIKELDAILSHLYKDDPVKYAAWKSASRVERPPVRKKVPPVPVPTAGGGGASTVTSAPVGGEVEVAA